MKLVSKAAQELAASDLTGADLKVWLNLIDNKFTATELSNIMQLDVSNVSKSCNKLLESGWIEVSERIGRSKRYTARADRDKNAQLNGQIHFD